MTAKEYLHQARNIQIKLGAMAEQLQFLKAAAEQVTPQYSDTPKSTTRNIHKSEDAIIRVLDFEQRMKEQYDMLTEINDTVDKLQDPLQRTVLVKRYFSVKTWREIALETYYSERTIRYIHTAALAEVRKLIETMP